MDIGRRYTDSGIDQAKKVLDAMANNNGNGAGGNGTGPLGYGGRRVPKQEADELLGISLPSSDDLKALRDKVDTTKDRVDTIKGKVTAGKDAVENFKLSVEDLKTLRRDLRRVFLVKSDPELDAKLDQAASIKDYTNPQNILLLSQSVRETTSSIVAAEKLLLSPMALVVLAGIIAVPVGIGYWWGKRNAGQVKTNPADKSFPKPPRRTRKKFCGASCREAYQSDRTHGLIYGSWDMGDNRTVGWEEGCAEQGICTYCKADL